MCKIKRSFSWSKSLRVSWEQRAFSNVADAAEQFDHSFQANTTSTVGRCSILECINVILNSVEWYFVGCSSLSEEFGVMNSLRSRCDLFATHEEIVRIGVVGIVRVQHCVEWTSICRVSVQHVKVSVIFFFDKFSECLFGVSAEIVELSLLNSRLREHLDGVFEVELDHWFLALKRFKRVLLIDDCQFLGVFGFQALEYVHKHVCEQIQYLKVVLVEDHLDIEASEFAQMSVRVGVLGAEHWSNFEDALHVAAQNHLLGELGRLRQTRFLAEVVETEHIRTAFGSAADQLRRVDLCELTSVQELSE